MKFYLIDIDSSDYIEVKDKLSIGRKNKCDLIIKDDLVSGRHCQFHVNGHIVFIEDLNASNPVEVNNVQINSASKVRIRSKDKIKIGSKEYYLSKSLPSNEHTYKSIILEKVKIHETFESDMDYQQNEKHWYSNEINGNSAPSDVKKRPKTIKSSHVVASSIDDQEAKLIDLNNKITLLEDKVAMSKKYTEEEITEKISLYSEKINQYTKMRDEVFAIQSLYEQILECRNLKDKLELEIKSKS